MKAIILTYAEVTDKERELLLETDIFKVAINQHAESLKPSIRICGDFNIDWILTHYPEPVVSIRQKIRYPSNRILFNHNVEFRGATIICAVEWLIAVGYDNILIVGDNTVNTEDFKDNVLYHTTRLRYWSGVQIYQYREGNFMLPVKSVERFIND